MLMEGKKLKLLTLQFYIDGWSADVDGMSQHEKAWHKSTCFSKWKVEVLETMQTVYQNIDLTWPYPRLLVHDFADIENSLSGVRAS